MVRRNLLLYFLFFALTFITATLAGVQWLHKDPLDFENFSTGLPYSGLLLLFFFAHECGHWVAARIHNVETTFPLFLPFPFFSINPFGTLGAVIRIKGRIPSKKALFDIGASGPLAGFVVSVAILAVGFRFLPQKEFLYTIHPEYANLEAIPAGGLTFGNSILYSGLAKILTAPQAFVPPMNELYHYPFLCVGWLGLLVTAMNLLPIGQLDGGHISFSMWERRYALVARVSLMLLLLLGLMGLLPLFGVPFDQGWYGWLIWGAALMVLTRFPRVLHPQTDDGSPLDRVRLGVGFACWVVFVLCFIPSPFSP